MIANVEVIMVVEYTGGNSRHRDSVVRAAASSSDCD